MRKHMILGLLAVTAVFTFAAGFAWTEDEPEQPMSEGEMWAKMNELAQPAEMHTKVLARLVGTWNVKGKLFTGMGEIPTTATAEHTWAMGKRFVQVHYKGQFMGEPFEGGGHVGYDNLGKTFQQTWVMTMATSIDVMTGSWNEKTSTLTWTGSMKMPNNKVYKKRTTVRFKSADEIFEESFATGPDGKEHKEMELTLSRRKAEPK